MDLVAYFQNRNAAGSGWILVDGIITLILGLLVWRPYGRTDGLRYGSRSCVYTPKRELAAAAGNSRRRALHRGSPARAARKLFTCRRGREHSEFNASARGIYPGTPRSVTFCVGRPHPSAVSRLTVPALTGVEGTVWKRRDSRCGAERSGAIRLNICGSQALRRKSSQGVCAAFERPWTQGRVARNQDRAPLHSRMRNLFSGYRNRARLLVKRPCA